MSPKQSSSTRRSSRRRGPWRSGSSSTASRRPRQSTNTCTPSQRRRARYRRDAARLTVTNSPGGSPSWWARSSADDGNDQLHRRHSVPRNRVPITTSTSSSPRVRRWTPSATLRPLEPRGTRNRGPRRNLYEGQGRQARRGSEGRRPAATRSTATPWRKPGTGSGVARTSRPSGSRRRANRRPASVVRARRRWRPSLARSTSASTRSIGFCKNTPRTT